MRTPSHVATLAYGWSVLADSKEEAAARDRWQHRLGRWLIAWARRLERARRERGA